MNPLLERLLREVRPHVKKLLASLPQRPGRCMLYPNWFGEFGPSVKKLADCVHPLVFDTGIEDAKYGILGSGFLARFRNRIFLITAGHCLSKKNGNDLRIALSATSNACVPFKGLYLVENGSLHSDSTDVALVEVAQE